MDIGVATIYRVLAQFEQAGVLRRSRFDAERVVYELNEGEHHDHIVCVRCGRVVEFVDADIERRQQEIASARGFELVDHTLALFGMCQPVCGAAEPSSAADEGAALSSVSDRAASSPAQRCGALQSSMGFMGLHRSGRPNR